MHTKMATGKVLFWDSSALQRPCAIRSHGDVTFKTFYRTAYFIDKLETNLAWWQILTRIHNNEKILQIKRTFENPVLDFRVRS